MGCSKRRWRCSRKFTRDIFDVAKHSTTQTRKFKVAQHRLGIPGPHLLGYLEYLWQSAHVDGDPVFANAEEVEIAAEWTGDAGALCAVLVDTGWLDLHDDGTLEVHDYWEHAPKYVVERKRLRDKRNSLNSVGKSSQQIPTNSNKFQQTPTKRRLLDTTNTNTNTNTSTKSLSKAKQSRGDTKRGRSPESVGDLALRCIADFDPVQEHEPDDTLGYHRALISEATGGAFKWRGGHLMRLEGILAHTRGPALIRERIVDALSNSESEAIRDPAAFANSALVELARELGVTI